MEGNDLVTENIVAGSQAGGDGDGLGQVVGDELVRGPGTTGGRARDETALGNLEEFKGGLVDGAAVTVAVGKVVDDGAVVGIRPGVPLQGD